MADNVELYCKHCGTSWQSSLEELKKVIYRGAKKLEQKSTLDYRTACPKCGKFMIVKLQDD